MSLCLVSCHWTRCRWWQSCLLITDARAGWFFSGPVSPDQLHSCGCRRGTGKGGGSQEARSGAQGVGPVSAAALRPSSASGSGRGMHAQLQGWFGEG